MKQILVAPGLTAPTFETVKDLSSFCFKKVEEFLRRIGVGDATLRISVDKVSKFYEVKFEVLDFPGTNPFVKVADYNLRKAIHKAYTKIKKMLMSRKS
ncbi:hypothetical protein D6810_02560 [Candidatus Dojkabacteria bacterium]|uniref:Ribosome-associated translation inhibitor RaiA n=1 Tax=Candidatus Dojkabacteria bacterium TaxID=2099670 RepID=A0A3M0Z1L2_9BACT|nr:MAG: hypothetical protein D6810_02560 [Candidatus Dojkabacteria bacterium]